MGGRERGQGYSCNGVTQLSRLSGQEYPGLLLLTLVAIYGLMSSKIEEKNFQLLLNKSLVLYQLLMVHQLTETDVISLDNTIKEYLTMFKNIIGPLQIMRSRVGLKLTKCHALLHMGYFIREYGSPLNFLRDIWRMF